MSTNSFSERDLEYIASGLLFLRNHLSKAIAQHSDINSVMKDVETQLQEVIELRNRMGGKK